MAKSYIYQQLDPGDYTVMSKAENDSTATVTIEAGKNYFMWQEVKMGVWAARSDLQTVDQETGMKGVQACKLLNTLNYN